MTKSTEPKPAGRMETALTAARNASGDAVLETRYAARRAGKAMEANPLAVVAGGIAFGLIAGALIPKSKRESELLGGVGKRVSDVAAGAGAAARDAAKAELASLPLTKSAAREQVAKVIDQVARAISSAGEAALKARDEAPTAPKKAAQKAK
jgi:hypothetical protein